MARGKKAKKKLETETKPVWQWVVAYVSLGVVVYFFLFIFYLL
jgi:hypothetical protein